MAQSTKKDPDYYKDLGVPRGASTDEIKRQYYRLARQYHPDVNPDPEAEEKFKTISKAYDVLGDDQKRQIHDEELTLVAEVKEQRKKTKAKEGFSASIDDYLSSLKKKVSQPLELEIFENDLGLFAALVEANKSGIPGEWTVRKADTDTREWMPEVVFAVKRDEAGSIAISRTVKDLRPKGERNWEIRLQDEMRGVPTDNLGGPNDLVEERYLTGDRQIYGTFSSPDLYQAYFTAMKNLASRLVRRDTDTQSIVAELNEVGRFTKSYDLGEINNVSRRLSLTSLMGELEGVTASRVTYTPRVGKEGASRKLEGPTSPGEGNPGMRV